MQKKNTSSFNLIKVEFAFYTIEAFGPHLSSNDRILLSLKSNACIWCLQ
jgi:hypothetical protein